MKVAIYARVSTKEQTAENQLLDLRRYCTSRGWEITREFVDSAVSGAKDDRPALRELTGFVRKRLADVVLVWRFDRFARSLRHLITALTELNELGIHFVSYSESIDTSTSQGRLVFGIMGAIAEFERDLITERINSGLRRAKAQGVRLGRPDAEFDFEKANQMRTQGRSLREIAGELNVSAATLSRVFQNHVRNSGNASVGEASQ